MKVSIVNIPLAIIGCFIGVWLSSICDKPLPKVIYLPVVVTMPQRITINDCISVYNNDDGITCTLTCEP